MAEASTTAEAPYPKPTYAWFVVGVLIFAALIAFIDRQVVAIVVDPMKEDLGVGDAQIGNADTLLALDAPYRAHDAATVPIVLKTMAWLLRYNQKTENY